MRGVQCKWFDHDRSLLRENFAPGAAAAIAPVKKIYSRATGVSNLWAARLLQKTSVVRKLPAYRLKEIP